MEQSKILAIASAEKGPAAEKILECEDINCLGVLAPQNENVEKAASLPADAVVIFTDSFDADELSFTEKLYMSRLRMAFILVCPHADSELLSRAMGCGITKVLSMDSGEEAIRSGILAELRRVRMRSESAKVREYDSKVISVFSTKGGSGKTTIAVNLATALQQKGKQVALVDLDLQFGDVGIFLNIPRCETISDMCAEESLTPGVVKSYLFKHQSGVHILCAPVSPELSELVKPEHIEKMTTLLRPEFDFVIYDLAPALDDTTITALEQSDTVYFVTNPEIPTLKNTKTCIGILKALGVSDKLKLVLNRDGDEFIKKKDVQSSLDMETAACIPIDQKVSSSAINRGIPAVTASPKSKMSKALIKFAEEVAAE